MQWTVVVGRYSPPGEPQPKGEPGGKFPAPYQNAPPKTYQTFKVDLPDHAMVLDALIAIREYQDESLGVRCACRSAICGSCAMWVNGHARLVCTSKLSEHVSGRQGHRRSAAVDADHQRPRVRHVGVLEEESLRQAVP